MPAHELAVLLVAIAAFAFIFRVALKLSWQHVPVFRDFSIAEQGDWASRVNSTLHSLIIVPGMLYVALWEDWDSNYLPLKSMDVARTFFSISCGYFIFDIYVLVRWRVPMWRVFFVHHVVAMTPYLIYNFHSGCDVDAYLLTLFLLVEIAVIPLNIATFLEQLGYGKSELHQFFYYATYVSWFFARVVLPLYNVYVLWWVLIPVAKVSPVCVIPAAVCGHLIAAFCVGVFIFVWTPDMLAKWREPVVDLDEYPDYKLTLRQSITPRASPICTPKRSYGTMEP